MRGRGAAKNSSAAPSGPRCTGTRDDPLKTHTPPRRFVSAANTDWCDCDVFTSNHDTISSRASDIIQVVSSTTVDGERRRRNLLNGPFACYDVLWTFSLVWKVLGGTAVNLNEF